MTGRSLLGLVGAVAVLLALLLLAAAAVAYFVASAGVLDYGVACHSQDCVDEAWATFLAAGTMGVGTFAAIVLLLRGSPAALRAACAVAVGYGLVGLVHAFAFGSLLWVPSVTAGLLALGAAMRLEARAVTARRT